MIRFLVICLSTLGVLGAVFFLMVWHAQPPAASGGTSPVPATPSPMQASHSADGLGPGSKPWMISYDEQGRVVSKFTADQFQPQPDGSFRVGNPIAVFYLDRGQVMRVTGDSGLVDCDSSAPGSSKGLFSTPTTSPRTGSLHKVQIELYPSAASTKPTQWMDADNIHFDNDHLRMWTDDIMDHGKVVTAGDQVPVTIRGEEYEFDGRGMTLIWNGISRRLEELQIVHGHRLVIKDPAKLASPGMSAPVPAKPGAAADLGTGVSQLVSADQSAVSSVLAQSPKPLANAVQPPTPYRALFHDHVRIDDADRTMATADLMTVDFLQGSNNAKPQVAPTTAAGNPSANPAPIVTTPSATKPATTKPVNGPVTIYWTGPLMVTPLRGEPMMPLASGQSIVKLVGSPVKLTPEGSTVEAASATYRSPDGAVRLESSPAIPVIHLTQGKDLKLQTQRIDYDPVTSQATLSGPSSLQVAVGTRPMNVTWSKTGVLHVVRLSGQPNGVDQVDLMDDVDVKHPQFTLTSRELQLALALMPKPKGQANEAEEQLKLLTAKVNVHCRLIQAGKAGREGIDSDMLVIHTERAADNSTVPREVEATGHVNAFDPDQGITADYLQAMLLAKPKTGASTKATTKSADEDVASAVELESLYAHSHVHAHLKTGATADTDRLHVTGPEGNRLVRMIDANGSKLTDGKKSSLASTSEIQLKPDQGGVSVAGPGVMTTIRTSSTTKPSEMVPPQPMEVSWQESMKLDSRANVADLFGAVTVVNHDVDGAIDTIIGDKSHIDLVDSPKNVKKRPATQPDPMTAAMGGKELKKLTLTGHVLGVSKLIGPGGAVLRQGQLHGDELVYTAVDGLAVVPGAGTLFVENHKPDSKEAGNNRGEMAIAWKKKLTYDENNQIITIDGNTVTGFKQEPNAGKPAKQDRMQLYAEQLVLTLTRVEPTAGHAVPAAGKLPAAKSPADQSGGKMQLSKMQAFGQVRFIAPAVDLTCGTVEFNPLQSLLIAKGTEKEPGECRNAAQNMITSFDELEYDTIKEEVLNVRGSKVQMRH